MNNVERPLLNPEKTQETGGTLCIVWKTGRSADQAQIRKNRTMYVGTAITN